MNVTKGQKVPPNRLEKISYDPFKIVSNVYKHLKDILNY